MEVLREPKVAADTHDIPSPVQAVDRIKMMQGARQGTATNSNTSHTTHNNRSQSGVPEENPRSVVFVPSKEEAKYARMFDKLRPEGGYLSGKRAVTVLRKSGLPQDTLAHVWSLADSDLDGQLSVKEFSVAMHLIGRVRSGLALPELPRKTAAKKKPRKEKKSRPPTSTNTEEGQGERRLEFTRSPKRLSRLASLTQSETSHGFDRVHGSIPKQNEPEDLEQAKPQADHQDGPLDKTRSHTKAPAVSHDVKPVFLNKEDVQRPNNGERVKAVGKLDQDKGGMPVVGKKVEGSRRKEVESRQLAARDRKRETTLRQLNDKDVDAVFAESQGAIDSLRDVQSWRVLMMGLQRLSAKDEARHVPVKVRLQRRHTLPLVTKGELARNQDFLPGLGRRTSFLWTAYEPAAIFLMKRAEKRSVREVELEKNMAKAAENWNLKPLPEKAERDTGDTIDARKTDSTRGNLNVAGLPLLDEDIDVIVHLLRQNHFFKRLDLSRCFLSEKHFIALAQALAWNSRIEELHLQECVFTCFGTAALVDVLTVNKHIHTIDLKGCKGLDEHDIRVIIRTGQNKGNLLTFNGMELAALRAEGSNVLDLSGWGLGYVESVVVADCLRTRANGLETVDLHDNALSSEALTFLMGAFHNQSQLRTLDLSHNMIDERSLPQIGELLRVNANLADVKLGHNRINCTEFEPYGLGLMKLLSWNNTVTVFDVEENRVSPKMLTIISEKLAANRAVRKDMTFVDCLRLKYPRITPRPILADQRRLHLKDVDVPFTVQEGIPAVQTTVRTERAAVFTLDGMKPGPPLDLFFVKNSIESDVERRV